VTHDPAHAIALAQVPGVGPILFRRLCDRFGSPENVFHAPPSDLRDVPGLTEDTRDALKHARRRVEEAGAVAAALADEGVTVFVRGGAGYPAALDDLAAPPPVLYLVGRLPGPEERRFSVAGSTRPSARGSRIARAAGGELARAGWTVVSGYARGIDSAAHLGALEADGRTVLVLPTGVRTFAPRGPFRELADEVGRRIVLVSECPPDAAWTSRAAVWRDRIIAALGRALLVVEARPESGTMITFRHARRLGRPSYVVRYRRASRGASGNRRAIEMGGVPVASMGAIRRIARAEVLPTAPSAARQGELF
jgi:DNA processing protein